jgi:hypothetical protein
MIIYIVTSSSFGYNGYGALIEGVFSTEERARDAIYRYRLVHPSGQYAILRRPLDEVFSDSVVTDS